MFVLSLFKKNFFPNDGTPCIRENSVVGHGNAAASLSKNFRSKID